MFLAGLLPRGQGALSGPFQLCCSVLLTLWATEPPLREHPRKLQGSCQAQDLKLELLLLPLPSKACSSPHWQRHSEDRAAAYCDPVYLPDCPSTFPRPYLPIKAPIRAHLFPETFWDHWARDDLFLPKSADHHTAHFLFSQRALIMCHLPSP